MSYVGETSKQVKFRVEKHRKNITQHHQTSLVYQRIAQEHHRHELEQCFHFEQAIKYIFTIIF